ncbi:uncharacterized protein LOC141590802 [Silene latifolia]|uniref:uncharacterized protein LOC141590802 n=1 Tax=Silene latifolia TaxID=37657 RepID=UPI003D77A477
MYKVSKRKKPPQFMEGTAYKELMEKRDTPEFKEKSARAAINKRGGKKDAHIDATHYGGSQSFYDRAMSNAAKNKGKMPTVPELFYETHTKEGAKGKRVWNSKKNANLYAKFRLRKERNPDISDNELWLDLVDGFNKGGCSNCSNLARAK